MKGFMKEIRILIKRLIMLRDDNLGSISLTENTKKLALVKHIDVKYHLIRDLVKKKQVRVLAIRSAKNLADLFTKALPRAALSAPSHSPPANLCYLVTVSSAFLRPLPPLPQ